MDRFYKIYIALLFISSQNFVTSFADNVTHEQKILAKVLTNFLKVPWINLNSSWTDTVKSTCRNDIVTLFESADVGEMWALQMLDATSKIPAGILVGNIWELGMFDECVAVTSQSNPANIQGQYCMVSLSIPTKFFGDTSKMMRIQKYNLYNPSADVDLSLSMSVCVPSTCGVRDIESLVNASIEKIPELTKFEVGIAKVACSSFGPPSELTLGSILVISLFAVIATFLLACTVCDFMLRRRFVDGTVALRNVAKFSLYTNAIKLLSTDLASTESMPAIHGIRFLSTCLIVTVHRFFSTLLLPKVDLSNITKLMQTVTSSFVFTLPFVVDTFFVMSGFFMALSFLKLLRSKDKVNLLVIYVRRYFRITPCIAVLLLFTIFIIPNLGTGPIWKYILEATVGACQKNWWTNLLHVQNIVNVDQICLLHTWYVAAEMQLFWFSPIILYPLYYRPKIGLILLSFALIGSFCAPAIQLMVNHWSVFFAMHKRSPVIFMENMRAHPATYNRGLPYFIGILMGYDLSNKRRQIPKLNVAINWILASLSVIFCGWIVHHIQPNVEVYNPVWEGIYVSVGRLAWSLAMAWVIYACTQGYGGPVTKFLSLPIFAPLSRMSYNIYLVHFVIQVATAATERTAQNIRIFSVVHLIWGDIAISIIVAFVLSVCIESPIMALEKILLSKPSTVSMEHILTIKQTKFSDEVKMYLDSTRDRFTIEMITSSPDFWERISDDLNTISEGPSKTPAEWSKIWQDWQSKLLKINNIHEVQSTAAQSDEIQLKTEVTSLEKELMVFLAAVDCNFSDSTGLDKMNIKPLKSQLNVSDRECDVLARS